LVPPQLTTIAIPHYELGRKSIEVLLDGPPERSDAESRIHRVKMTLRKRQSV
jgi:LacI family transcriptional regulator